MKRSHPHLDRINRVLDFIEARMEERLDLDRLADVACFSPFHFHRIFKEVMGVTASDHIRRIRLERAADRLIRQATKPVTEIAIQCGFSGSAVFSRSFRKAYGMTPTQWRYGGYRKNCKLLPKSGKDAAAVSHYFHRETNTRTWRMEMENEWKMDIRTEKLPQMRIAYVRHVGPYAGNAELFEGLYGRLMGWAGPRGLLQFPLTKMLTVYHDNPQITPEDELRISAAISVGPEVAVDGEIGEMTLPGGTYACARCELLPHQYPHAWNELIQTWLPGSGYRMDGRPCFEIYLNQPGDHPEGKHVVDICVSVAPA